MVFRGFVAVIVDMRDKRERAGSFIRRMKVRISVAADGELRRKGGRDAAYSREHGFRVVRQSVKLILRYDVERDLVLLEGIRTFCRVRSASRGSYLSRLF